MARLDPTLRERSRRLRRDGTEAERRLWQLLRSRRFAATKFRRQHSVGPFVADFCCVETRLVIELDGGQHAEQVRADEQSTEYLQQHGYRVLRFWNNDVLRNTEGILGEIEAAVKDAVPSPPPSPASNAGEGVGRRNHTGEGVGTRGRTRP